MFKPFNLRFKA